jgi:hypothetical protein
MAAETIKHTCDSARKYISKVTRQGQALWKGASTRGGDAARVGAWDDNRKAMPDVVFFSFLFEQGYFLYE